MRFFLFILSLLAFSPAYAQNAEALPDLPAPIQNLVNEGAQIRYLGKEQGYDSWITIKNGQEQYFYVPPGGKRFFMGVMFDDTGKLVTVEQVQKLRAKEGATLDALADDFGFDPSNTKSEKTSLEFKTPSEQMYYDIENANWVPLGENGAPIVYAFIDPQCPHCHNFIEDLKPSIDAGKVQLRMVMVGLRPETVAQAAYMLATPDPQGRWWKHMDGDKDALPVMADINQQGVQRNLAVMQSWKFSATPMVVYRAKDGSVKIVRGRPQDTAALIADLGARS
ncbi:MAG: thiol:disulfide interchange protein DsbG [Alphaproteobacteria bacterium]|nr:thiol:disulfide interchange protein DsbG [Alphaproteobacteria bacterium]